MRFWLPGLIFLLIFGFASLLWFDSAQRPVQGSLVGTQVPQIQSVRSQAATNSRCSQSVRSQAATNSR